MKHSSKLEQVVSFSPFSFVGLGCTVGQLPDSILPIHILLPPPSRPLRNLREILALDLPTLGFNVSATSSLFYCPHSEGYRKVMFLPPSSEGCGKVPPASERWGKVLFSVCLSVHTSMRGGGYPSQVWMVGGGYPGMVWMVGAGGYPSQVWMMGWYPSQVWMVRGYSSQVWMVGGYLGYPQPGLDGGGIPPGQVWMVGGTWVSPEPGLDGVPPPTMTGWGTPPTMTGWGTTPPA